MKSHKHRLIAALGIGIALSTAAACKKKDDAPPANESATAPAAATPPAAAPGTTPPTDTAAPGAAPATPPAGGTAPPQAVAEVKPASGSQVTGTVTFTEESGGVEIAVDVRGLPPGDHGFHLHEVGDCSAPDAKSAGDHFNPDKHPHGGPDATQHHAGDLGNLTAGPDGTVKETRKAKGLTVAEGRTSVVNRAVVIHEKADDLKSQPAGNAGARIACGAVQLKK